MRYNSRVQSVRNRFYGVASGIVLSFSLASSWSYADSATGNAADIRSVLFKAAKSQGANCGMHLHAAPNIASPEWSGQRPETSQPRHSSDDHVEKVTDVHVSTAVNMVLNDRLTLVQVRNLIGIIGGADPQLVAPALNQIESQVLTVAARIVGVDIDPKLIGPSINSTSQEIITAIKRARES